MKTREEEITKAAKEFISIFPFTGSRSVAFEHGALWADEHQKNPWHKTPYNTPDEDAGRIKGKEYIVSVNGEIYKATYEGYGCWALGNGRYRTENKFTEIYWMPVPEIPEGGEQ